MNTKEIATTFRTLAAELVNGSPEGEAFMLNPGDEGLLKSLQRLPAKSASASSDGGASIAAHVDHIRYGLSLINRWAAGANPFADANWGESWKIGSVTEPEWTNLRAALSAEAEQWLETLSLPREVNAIELNGLAGSIAHLAYHLGAIRQIDRSLRGPVQS